MKSLRIAHTVYLLLGLALLAGGSASTFLMIRCSMVSARYTAIVQGEIAQAQQVRVVQVTFKKQVQAWKDILLRWTDPAALKKYDTEFHALSDQVQVKSIQLEGEIKDPQARATLESFIQQHRALNGSYESALGNYKLSLNYAEGDAAVKGKDRRPTDSLDRVAEQSQASALVGKSMNDIARTINDSSDGAAGSAQTALELVELSRQLEGECGQFKTNIEMGRPQLVARSRVA